MATSARGRILWHGTTRRRAEAILQNGPNVNFREPARSSPPLSLDQVRQEIERLVRERLVGRKTNVVAFVQELLAITRHVGEVSCSRAGDHGLRFQLNGEPPFEVDLDANRGKLRMMCAHLAVLSAENEPESAQIYGGEGTIRQTWKARWSNTTDKHDFTIHVAR